MESSQETPETYASEKPGGLDPKAAEIRAMFSSIAPSYDRLNHLLSFSIDRYWRWRTVRRTIRRAQGEVRRVLDVCAGTGDLSLAFARGIAKVPSTTPAMVAALDFSHGMILGALPKYARQSGESAPVPQPIEADATRLPVGDDQFDAASVAFGLRNLTDRAQGLREMRRAVRPGGIVTVLEFTMPRAWWMRPFYSFYLGRVLPTIGNTLSRSQAYAYLADTVSEFPSAEEVCQWMRDAGLAEVEAIPLTGGIAVLYTGVVQ